MGVEDQVEAVLNNPEVVAARCEVDKEKANHIQHILAMTLNEQKAAFLTLNFKITDTLQDKARAVTGDKEYKMGVITHALLKILQKHHAENSSSVKSGYSVAAATTETPEASPKKKGKGNYQKWDRRSERHMKPSQ